MACLTREQIEALAGDAVAGAQAEALRRHLGECATCRRRVEQARANERFLGRAGQRPDPGQAEGTAGGEPAVAAPAATDQTVSSASLEPVTSAGAVFATPPPDSFAGYQIIKELHRGGQGVVYQALQKSTKRKVAIKVMKEGPFGSHADRARFEREVEILGQLNHPNIVTVYDSGEAAGCHYFVMDYISGQPLDEWMRGAASDPRAGGGRSIVDTLRLFAKICDAVNSAHLKGIIHRDLKPGNIRIDDGGEPHILDFGLAKVARGAEEASLMTMTGQFMGSLPWASPEQAEAKPGKIDLRTDVYSLGVILYQMLTGRFPYDVIGNMRDVLDRIMRVEPTKPSTIRRQINDEVETIVLKCLSKERDRRYQTAGELARDIGHYLAGEPVEAKRDSALYVLKKQLRRYKAPVAVAAAFIALIAARLVMSLVLWRHAVVAEQQQSHERERADQKAGEAEAAAGVLRDTVADLRRSMWTIYVNTLHWAQLAYDAGDFAALRAALAAAPDEYRGWEWGHFSRMLDTSVAVLNGHEGSVWSAAFSPDGTRIVTASRDRTARVWDAATGQALAVLKGHENWVNTAAFSPDGTRIVTASSDQTARVWDAATGQTLVVLKGRECQVYSGGFSPDGTRIVTASPESTAGVWDAATGAALAELKGHTGVVLSAAFSPDGTRIVTASYDRTARVWDAATGQALAEFKGHTSWVESAAFSPDGTRVVTASRDNTARVWDAATGAALAELKGHTWFVRSGAFSPDGTRIVTAGDKSARVWDAATGEARAELKGHTGWVWSAAFSPDGTRIVTASWDGTARLWDADTGQALAVLMGHEALVGSAAFSPDGTRIVTASHDQTARVWDAATGAALAELKRHTDWVLSAAFSPDGTRIVTASGDKTARVWDAATGQELAVLKGHEDGVHSAGFSPDGTRIMTVSSDKTARLWDAHTGAEVAVLRGQTGYVRSEAFSPDGTRIVTASGDQTARVWDAATGQALVVLKGHESQVYSAGFSPDGTQIVTASGDNTARVWDAATGQTLAVLKGPEYYEVTSAAFSPDGTRIVTASRDNTARLWDAATGAALAELKGHTDGVLSIGFSPDGTRIVTASEDRTARLWDSVSNVQRHQERRAVVTALASARPLVEQLHTELRDWSRVAGAVRANPSLDAEVRRQALNEVLRRASADRERARAIADRLLNEVVLSENAARRLEADTSLEPHVRKLGIEHVRAIGDEPLRLNNAAWSIVSKPGADPARYDVALEAARRAVAAEPDNGNSVNTLGVAQFRAGHYEEALGTLTRSDALNSRADAPQNRPPAGAGASQPTTAEERDLGQPADVAFIAMSLQRLGRTDDARAALVRLRALLGQQRWSADAEAQAFLREAEALIAATATPGGDERSP